MQSDEKRNVLRIGPPKHPGETEITLAMVETVRQRIRAAGGTLSVWAVLSEDGYETSLGDGFYLHMCAIALNSADAEKLAALGPEAQFTKWHVRNYQLGLENDAPVLKARWRPEEEFTINYFVEILCEIRPGETTSKLLTGSRWRKDGPLLSLS